MPRLNARKKLGFTLIEILVIILIVGILSAITIPSFVSLIDNININNAVIEARAALQTGQREAIRRSQVCNVGLNVVNRTVMGSCLSGDRNLPAPVDFATNIGKKSSLPSSIVNINFGVLGTAEFIIDPEEDLASSQNPGYLEMSSPQVSPQSNDPSGKIVFYIANKTNSTKKCIAISGTLGLTRIGNYTGKIKNKFRLSKKGTCTAS